MTSKGGDSRHSIKFMASSANGYSVCACGATQKVENWKPTDGWHECYLCVIPNYHKEEVEA